MYSVLHFIRVPSVFHPWLKTHFLIRSVIDRREHENQIRRGSFEPRMKHGLNTDYEKRRTILDVFRFAFHPCSIRVRRRRGYFRIPSDVVFAADF